MDPELPKPLPDFESSILELAMLKGMLSSDEVLTTPSSAEPDPGLSRLEELVQEGRLNEESIGLLALELIGRSRQFFTSIQGSEEEPEAALSVPLSWKGYTQMQPIGMGGGGMVYRAWDPQLDRWVALKFLRSDSSTKLRRLLKEARAQAKVDHPHILKVHEVGQHDGQPFIAMQLVQDSTLQELRNTIGFEQKLRLIMQVADGLHAAHQHGLIHLDIKPANILVERTDQGEPWPFLTDFGLVREDRKEKSEKRASIGGTPGFASPEQTRGDLDLVDRRSDVYSLGATLYFILAGTRAFDGLDANIQESANPIPLRNRNRRIPKDVEAIVAKCLKFHPSDRYATTRELAEDLGRFLQRQPVRARRSTWAYLGLRWIQRNHLKAMVYLAGCLLLALTIWSIQAARRAVLQTQLAVRYGQEVQTIEQMLRTAHLSRIHDRRPTLELVRQSMDRIRQEMIGLGAPAFGPGSFALGEGYFALGNNDLAWNYIDQAWRANFHSPACAQIRGRLLTIRFLKEKAQIRGEDAATRERSLKRIERDYRDPALDCLRIAREGALNPPYQRALEAYLKGDLDGVLKDIEELNRSSAWIYEANYLGSDILREKARHMLAQGHNPEAKAFLEASGKALERALDVAPSDPQNWALWGWWCLDMADFPDATAQESSQWVERGKGAFETSMSVDPGYHGADEGLAQVFAKFAGYARDRGEDCMALLDKSVAFSDSSLLKMGPSVVVPDHGWILITRAEERLLRNEDARPDLDLAIAHLRKAQAWNSSYSAMKGLEDALSDRAYAAFAFGQDPAPYLQESLHWASETGRIDPEDPTQKFAILKHRLDRAELETLSLRAPSDSLEGLRADLEALPPIMRDDPTSRWYLGEAQGIQALRLALAGADPSEGFRSCFHSLEEALKQLPGDPDYQRSQARWRLLFASWQQQRGLKSEVDLNQTLRMIRSMKEHHPFDATLRALELGTALVQAPPHAPAKIKLHGQLQQCLAGNAYLKGYLGPWVTGE